MLVAGAVTAVRRRGARVGLAVSRSSDALPTVSHTSEVDPAFLPGQSARAGDYSAVLPLNDPPIGYERLPEATTARR